MRIQKRWFDSPIYTSIGEMMNKMSKEASILNSLEFNKEL